MGKVLKAAAAAGMGAALIAGMVVLPRTASATGAYTLTFSVDPNAALETSLSVQGADQIKVTVTDGDSAEHTDWVMLDNALTGSGTVGEAACSSTTSCTITVSDGTAGALHFSGNNGYFSLLSPSGQLYPGDTLSESMAITVGDYVESDSPEVPFSGRVWFVWNCDGNFCKSFIEDIDGTEDVENPDGSHTLTYHTKMIHDTDINDATDATKHPDASVLAPSDYRFVWEHMYPLIPPATATWDEYQAWEESYIDGDYDKQFAYIIDPTGAQNGANIISTNGARAFRLTIYHDGYYGVTNASNPEDLTFYPEFWGEDRFNPAYDVSETSLDNPQTIKSYLLEPKITLSSDGGTAISALTVASPDVPADAVTITDAGAGKWDIVFNSNFYDDVTFKVTGAGQDYYVRVVRMTVNHDTEDIVVRNKAILYYPAGDTNDYDVIATYHFSDRDDITTTLVPTGSAQAGGKGLSKKAYTFSTADSYIASLLSNNNNWTGVSYTVVKKGSTATHYAGTLAGSGKGVYYGVHNGHVTLGAGN